MKDIMIAIQKELKVSKNQENKFGGYKYRSCEDILEAVKPILAKHDVYLNITDDLEYIGDRYYIRATASVVGEKGVVSSSALAREPLLQKGMNEAQITGSASSYARKYALNGLLAIDDTKDADTQDNRGEGKKEQISPEPINQAKVDNAVIFFKAQIDMDSPEDTHDKIRAHFKTLSNDEKIAAADKMADKAPNSNKMYKSLLKDHLGFKPTTEGRER